MAAELLIQVRLDWTGPDHHDRSRALPCRVCTHATHERDRHGAACHKGCLEDEIARELLGQGHRYIADERIAPTNPTREVTR